MHHTLKHTSKAALLALLSIRWMSGQEAPTSSSPDKKDESTVELSTFTVTGLRGSLASAAEIKQSNQQFVDSIVATDIDKLPDINVSYALSRIPGIQVAHTFAGLGGNGAVTIRGLNQIVSTLDGREVITPGGIANGTGGVGVGQRTFDYSQIPSALIAGIDVYKSSSANQIDGGLGGLVDVRMRKPFDFSEEIAAGATVGTSYSTLRGGKTEQNYSVFANASQNTGIGKIGILVAYSDISTPWREDAVTIGNPTPNATVATGVPTALTATGYNNNSSQGKFKTVGYNAVFEWQPTKTLEVYVGANHNKWQNIQDTVQFTTALPVSASVAGSGQMFAGSTTATQSATFTNVVGTAYGIIRDLQDQLNMYNIGGKYTWGDLTVKADLSRYTSEYRFHNNLAFASIAIPSLTYNLRGSLPSVNFTGVSLEDASQYRLGQVNYRLFPANSTGRAGRFDAEYSFKTGFFTKILAGARYNETTSDNKPTGLFLGSYSIPASANLLSQYPGQWRSSPIQDLFSGYSQPQFQQYLVQDTRLMRDAGALYKAYGATNTPDTSAVVNPLSLFDIKETTTSIYLMPQFAGKVAGLHFDGNFGVRGTKTKENTGGYKGASAASAVPITLSSDYTDWLPSFNFRLNLTEKLLVRLAASKTITRPSFGSLTPSVTLNANPVDPNLNSGSQGNPDLKPVRSTGYDLSLEYYPGKANSIYVALFQKDVTGFIGNFSEPRTYDGVTYLIQSSKNLNPAKIRGTEIGFQQFLDFLPAPFDGFGVQANFTYVDSSTPTTVAGAGAPVNAPLTNLSRKSYNIVAMYEKGPFSARLAYNWRDKFVTGFAYFVSTGLLAQELRAYGDLDASVNYTVSKNIQIALQGVNLTDALRYQYYGSVQFPSNVYLDGRMLMASVTLRF